MLNKVINFINYNNLIKDGDRILIALSGGPDSVCMLHILNSIKDVFNIKIFAAHVNHMLRGEEADKDEEYAKNLCETLNIEFFSRKIDIDKLAKKRGISSEMAGREARYEYFDFLKKEICLDKIAIAHNLNDQAETVLMNLMRGSGIEGLCGIRAKREGGIIRPILCLSREEIENYCEMNNLNPRIDKTNLENIYNRNKVRLDIIPYMKENFNKDIIETINRTSKIIQIDNEYLNKVSMENYEKYITLKDNILIINKEAFNLDIAILSRVIKRAFINFSKKHNNFEMKHIYDVINLSKNTTNKKIYLPNNIICENIYGDIKLKSKSEDKKNNNIECEEIELLKENLLNKVINYKSYKIEFEIINKMKNNIEFSNNVLIKYFDYDKIKERVIIRTRKNGDKIIPLGMKGSKRIKDIFIDLKIPVEDRNSNPLVIFDNDVAWIVGHKVSEVFKVEKSTKNVLKINFMRKEI